MLDLMCTPGTLYHLEVFPYRATPRPSAGGSPTWAWLWNLVRQGCCRLIISMMITKEALQNIKDSSFGYWYNKYEEEGGGALECLFSARIFETYMPCIMPYITLRLALTSIYAWYNALILWRSSLTQAITTSSQWTTDLGLEAHFCDL